MSAVEPGPTVEHILIALDASSHSMAALEAAAELGRRLRTRLVGLYIEDLQLLRAAELPFVREIGSASGVARSLDRHDLEQEFQVQARRAQQALATAAEGAQLEWEFQVRRGPVVSELLASASAADLITLGATGWSPGHHQQVGTTVQAILSQATSPVLVLRHGLRLGQPILILYDGSTASGASLHLAGRLARAPRMPLLVLIPDGSRQPELQPAAEQKLIELGLSEAHFVALPEVSPVRLAQLVKTVHAGVLVVPGTSSLLEPGQKPDWLGALECPVLIART